MHAIRLRGPWEFQVTPRAAPRAADAAPAGGRDAAGSRGPICGKITFPGATWKDLLADETPAGRVRLTRRFGCPAKLEPGERTWLVIELAERVTCARLNGQELAIFTDGDARIRKDISPILAHRNELILELAPPWDLESAQQRSCDPLEQRILGEVRLEIDDS